MAFPPSQAPDDTAGADSTAFHLHIAGLVASFIFGFVFFFLGLQKNLRWTPLAVVALGLATILFIWKQRLIRFEHQLGAWVIYFIAIAACFFLETQRLSIEPPESTPEESPRMAVAVNDLLGSFAGFNEERGKQRTFVVLVVEEINRTPSRIAFRYSLNENSVQRSHNYGLIYPSSKTLEIQNHTIFRYERDKHGNIELWSINRRGFRLSRISDQH